MSKGKKLGPVLPQWHFHMEFTPMVAFLGANGAGKSALAVTYVLDQAKLADVPLFTNIAVTDPDVDVRRIRGLTDIMTIEHAFVLFDDVQSVAPSRETTSSPPELVMELAALRHRDACLAWTSPTAGDVDLKLRQVTQRMVAMKAVKRKRREGQLWLDTVRTHARAFDTEGIQVTDIDSETPYTHHGFIKMENLRLEAYDTRERLMLQADHAVCMGCGLRKRREYCNCRHPLPVVVEVAA